MELFQELLFTVALSIVVCFILSKLLSMASSSGIAENNSVFTSGTDVIGKAVFYEQNYDKQSVVSEFQSERSVRFVRESFKVNQREEEQFRVENIANDGSELLVICDDDDIDDGEEGSRDVEVVALGELREEKVSAGPGGDELEDNVVDGSLVSAKFREIEIESENMVEEAPERMEFRDIKIGLVKDGLSSAKSEEVGVLESKGNKGNDCDGMDHDGVVDEEEGLFDDWEGIERTELEKRFGAAVVFVGSMSNADRISNLDNDVKMQLYGLHKVAIEGPCREPQPMALKISARAKWNAWQRLGKMNPELAMEQYITLLSRSLSGWMGDDTFRDGKQAFQDVVTSENLPSNLCKQPGAENERKSEKLQPCVEECDVIRVEGPNFINRDKQ